MKKNPNITFLLVPLLLVLLSGSVLIALPMVQKWRETRMEKLRNISIRVVQIIRRCRDILLRHPDLDLSGYESFLAAFEKLDERRQSERLDELLSTHNDLETETMGEILGITVRNPARTDNTSPLMQYKTFSPNGFKDFYDNFRHPGTRPITESPSITGHSGADARIIRIAEDRGYRLRAETEPDSLVKLGSRLLRAEAAAAWEKLKAEAGQEGIRLGIISTFRSPANQRRIFLNLLSLESNRDIGRSYTYDEIAAGKADKTIDRILQESSIPGYSKHHNGYTLDITDIASGKHFEEFGSTPGFRWISADNYLNAKRFGFVPSYPAGAARQGPNPEAWEYVWVGTEVLKRPPSLR